MVSFLHFGKFENNEIIHKKKAYQSIDQVGFWGWVSFCTWLLGYIGEKGWWGTITTIFEREFIQCTQKYLGFSSDGCGS